MDALGLPRMQRASHYLELAAKLREFAETETVEETREQLLAIATQYDELANRQLQPA